MTKYDAPIPERGSIVQLADDVLWARFDLPFRLNHINLYVLDAGDSWIIVDTGLNNDDTAAHWAMLLDGPLAGKPVSKVIASHHHVDHIGYAGTLVEITGAEAFTSAPEIAIAEWLKNMDSDDFGDRLATRYRSFGMSEDDVATGRNDRERYKKNVAEFPAFKMLAEGDVIESKNGTWDVRIDAGHSPGQISLYDKSRDIYIAVDFLLPRISPNVSASMFTPEGDFLGAYLSYLDDISKAINPETLVLPGHDWPFTDGPKRAAELIAHHHHRLDQIMERANEGSMTVADGMTVLFDRVFGTHELFFATGEAAAHMIHLVATKRLKVEEQDGILIYNAI